MHRRMFEKAGDVTAILESDAAKVIIGNNYERYKKLWIQQYEVAFHRREKVTAKGKYNLLAICCAPVWWAYRKLYGLYFGFLAAFAVLMFYCEYYQVDLPNISVGILIIGLYANEIYFEVMVKRVRKYESLPEQKKAKFLKLYGGTSELFGALSPFIFVATVGAVIEAADLLNN